MATTNINTTSQLQLRVSALLKELEQKNLQLQAVQRNYLTVSNLLHKRGKEIEASQASQQVLTEQLQQHKSQLEALGDRAAAAESQLKHGSHLPDQNLQLQKEVQVLKQERDEESEQRLALQDQLNKVKQELFAVANVKQALTEQLQEQFSQLESANTTVAKLKQQLETEASDNRATASQLLALRDVLSRNTAQQQDMDKQLAAWKARAKTAEELAASEQARATKLQQDLTNAKGSHANNAFKLMELTNTNQQLEAKMAKAAEALAAEQAARAEAQQQMEVLRSQAAEAHMQAEAAEANAKATAVALSKAQHAAEEAQAGQTAAEEARKTADASAKLAAQRLAEAQQEAAQERGVYEATQREVRELLASREDAYEQLQQQYKSWKFRQLEFMTRTLHALDSQESRVRAVDAGCKSMAAAVEQQSQEQQEQLAQQLDKLADCQAYVEQLEAAGDKINKSLAQLQQQWVARHQKLKASDKGIQVLQKQLDQLEQQLNMSTIMERKLLAELDDTKAARAADQLQAKLQAEAAEAALAAAKSAAETAQVAAAQHQAAYAEMETKLATADSEMVSLRYQLSAKENQLTGMSGNVVSANRRLQRLAGAATDIANMLERVGALQPQDVAAVMTKLAAISAAVGRPSTPSRPATASTQSRPTTAGSPSRPSTAGMRPSTASSRPTTAGGMAADDPSGSKQLLDGLGSMHHQMQVLVQAMQQLSESYPKLLDSWQESEKVVSSTVAKLMHVEESLASNYTCLMCMKVFDSPVAVVPCGHNYCKACFISSGNSCRECSSNNAAAAAQVSGFVPAPALEALCAKYDYRMLALRSLQSLLAQRQLHNIQAVAPVETS